MEFRRLQDLNNIKDVIIRDINLSHDVNDIKGYIIEEEDSSVVYITDTGYISESYFPYITNKNVYVFESNHDIEMLMNNKNYPHHTNKDSAYYLTKIIGERTKYIVLAHLSEQNNTEELALTCLKDHLNKKTSLDPKILIAQQNEISEVINI